MYPIRYYGDPVLRKKAAAVDTFDAELEEFCRILADKMYEYDGVGLAAPQIGVSRRVVAIDVTGGIEEPIVMVNPEILSTSEEELSDTEGCLSIPGISAVVTRPAEITVRGYSPQGEEL
ncbi:MAG: peptide deformylase, partial [Fibrobacterota bacterium]